MQKARNLPKWQLHPFTRLELLHAREGSSGSQGSQCETVPASPKRQYLQRTFPDWESLGSPCRGRSSRMRADLVSAASMVTNGKPRAPSKLMQEPRATEQESFFGVLMTLSSPQQPFIISFVPVASQSCSVLCMCLIIISHLDFLESFLQQTH